MRHLPLIALTALALAACKDSNVPFLTAPTSVPNSPVGIQNAISGLISGSRNDIGGYMVDAAAFGRDGGNYTNTEPRFITYELGIDPIAAAWGSQWANSYTNISQAHQILATIPNVAPAYTAAQAATVTGVVQTLEAFNYMIVAEDHDTLGIALLTQATASSPPPAVCNKNAWKFIVALLDSAHANLTTGGSTPIPVSLPSGFASVAGTATTFDSFNRALAGKAGLELAYAIARSSAGTMPHDTFPGSPDQAALTAADAAITQSALYSPAQVGPEPAGGWTPDAFSVMLNFSGASGDVVNPMNSIVGTFRILNTITNDQDTVNDLRWKAKFAVTGAAPQQQKYNSVVIPYIYTQYLSPASFIPIVRNEELVLLRAQIQIGLGNYPAAAALIDQVRMQAGGLPSALTKADTLPNGVIIPPVNPNNYASVRDFLLREQQISTAIEPSGDRMISIRMYNLAAQLDTTWKGNSAAAPNGDLHTTITPIPIAEVSARGGSFTTTCQ